MPRVLFINGNTSDFLADGVFHGLRTLLGADAVDFPKAEYLYEGFPPEAYRTFWGRGFTLYSLLPDLPIARHNLPWRALEGEFDLVIFGDIWHTFGLWTQWGPQLQRAGCPVVVLDGHDTPRPYPFSFFWWRRRYWWFLPRAHTRATYFKRERTPATRWFSSYLVLPPALGRTLDTRPISFSIPAEKIVAQLPAKDRDFPTHIVDVELARRLGARRDHAFTDEADYYADLRRARFGITTKRRGWDALRHYEIAACGAVPCFRDLDRRPPGCAPFGLNAANSISYRDADDLLDQVRRLEDERYAELQQGALAWAHANTTTARARSLLRDCGLDV